MITPRAPTFVLQVVGRKLRCQVYSRAHHDAEEEPGLEPKSVSTVTCLLGNGQGLVVCESSAVLLIDGR